MPYSPPEDLKRARQLLDEDKYQETLDVLTKFENKEDISTEDQIECLLIKGELNYILNKYEKAMNIAEKTFQMSKDQRNSILTFDSLYLKGRCVFFLGEDELPLILNQMKNIYSSLKDLTPMEHMKREANLNLFNGLVSYFSEDDYEKALEFCDIYLTINEKLGNKTDIAEALIWISEISSKKGDLTRSLKYAKQSLTYTEIRKRDKSKSLWYLGLISYVRGELDQGLVYTEQLEKISDEINHKGSIGWAFYVAGAIYRMKGDLDKALEHCKQGLKISDESEIENLKSFLYINIIRLYIDMGSYEEAKSYLTNFRQFVDQSNNKQAERMYHLSEGLVLKASPNLRDHFKAEMIFKEFIEAKKNVQYTVTAITHLCDLLLMELRRTNDLNILDELNPLITRFSNIAEYQESFWRLTQAKILQAKLALIQMNMGEARRLLTEAQLIANEHGLGLMAQKISNEHDKLLNQLSSWEKLKEENAPVSERIELSSFDEVIERLLEKRTVEPLKIMDEDPVLLLIIAEGGVLLFSYPFTEEWERDNELFGSFLSAITSFSNEFLSQGLDRVKFSQFTVLMETITHFSVYYVFKGQSYLAKQKLSHFIALIQDEGTILQALDKFYQTNQIIEINDFPFLRVFLKEVFTRKNTNSKERDY